MWPFLAAILSKAGGAMLSGGAAGAAGAGMSGVMSGASPFTQAMLRAGPAMSTNGGMAEGGMMPPNAVDANAPQGGQGDAAMKMAQLAARNAQGSPMPNLAEQDYAQLASRAAPTNPQAGLPLSVQRLYAIAKSRGGRY